MRREWQSSAASMERVSRHFFCISSKPGEIQSTNSSLKKKSATSTPPVC